MHYWNNTASVFTLGTCLVPTWSKFHNGWFHIQLCGYGGLKHMSHARDLCTDVMVWEVLKCMSHVRTLCYESERCWSVCLMQGHYGMNLRSVKVYVSCEDIMLWIWEVLKCMSPARTSQHKSEKCWWHYFLQRMQITGCTVFGVFPRGLDSMT